MTTELELDRELDGDRDLLACAAVDAARLGLADFTPSDVLATGLSGLLGTDDDAHRLDPATAIEAAKRKPADADEDSEDEDEDDAEEDDAAEEDEDADDEDADEDDELDDDDDEDDDDEDDEDEDEDDEFDDPDEDDDYDDDDDDDDFGDDDD